MKQMRAALGTKFTTEGWLAAAKEMKRLLDVNSRGALFEGWAAEVE